MDRDRLRRIGTAATVAALASNALLWAAAGGDMARLVPFEGILDGGPGALAVAAMLADAAFYALMVLLAAGLAGGDRVRAAPGVAYGLLGMAGALALAAAWAVDPTAPGTAIATAFVYRRVWNGVNAACGAVWWGSLAARSGPVPFRILSGVLALLAVAVGLAFALGAVAVQGALLPVLLAGLVAWPWLAGRAG